MSLDTGLNYRDLGGVNEELKNIRWVCMCFCCGCSEMVLQMVGILLRWWWNECGEDVDVIGIS